MIYPFYSIAEVSELLDVSKSTVYHWITQGRLCRVVFSDRTSPKQIILLEDLIDHLQEFHQDSKEDIVLRMRKYQRPAIRNHQATLVEKRLRNVNLKERKTKY